MLLRNREKYLDFLAKFTPIKPQKTSITGRRGLWIAVQHQNEADALLQMHISPNYCLPNEEIQIRPGKKPNNPRSQQIFLINVPHNISQDHLVKLCSSKLDLAQIDEPVKCFNKIPGIPFKARVTLANQKSLTKALQMKHMMKTISPISFASQKKRIRNSKHAKSVSHQIMRHGLAPQRNLVRDAFSPNTLASARNHNSPADSVVNPLTSQGHETAK